MATVKKYIVDETGQEVDQIEYDDSESVAVANVMAAYGFTREEAIEDLKSRGKIEGAERTSKENAERLIEQILGKSVPDRGEDTYGTGELRVVDDKPAGPPESALVISKVSPAPESE